MSDRLLLDTHALIWALSAPSKLPKRVVAALRDPGTVVYCSAASTWEIAIKSALGKIKADLGAVIRAAGTADFDELPITIAHTERVHTLPAHHRDPFDRILIAQALEEHLVLVTHYRLMSTYPVATLWA
ncbi:MAG: type II toxin-antitoxin system VapC family toxin [Deltaproteobacteria bacterium]|nr:type II toxin-antitoxin system VapC family toxin [Deltaproteobacteria bacterium]